MKDIEIAKKYLQEESLSLVVVKNGEIIFKSHGMGIRPMYELATEMDEMAKDSSLADKVIGRGAAILCKYIGIKEVYGELISKGAIEILEKQRIPSTYLNLTESIKNRNKTDLCPIEKMAKDIDNGELLLEKIGMFLKS